LTKTVHHPESQHTFVDGHNEPSNAHLHICMTLKCTTMNAIKNLTSFGVSVSPSRRPS